MSGHVDWAVLDLGGLPSSAWRMTMLTEIRGLSLSDDRMTLPARIQTMAAHRRLHDELSPGAPFCQDTGRVAENVQMLLRMNRIET